MDEFNRLCIFITDDPDANMVAQVSCAALMGNDAFKVELEVDFSRSSMPAFTMVKCLYPKKKRAPRGHGGTMSKRE